MVIETFKPGKLDEVYSRFHKQGRMMPEGLFYLDSWLEKGGLRCFQLMETENPQLFSEWMEKWNDLAGCEIVEIGIKPVKQD
ncbi:MAG: DUF3303 family protein [Fibrobacteria bacterium]